MTGLQKSRSYSRNPGFPELARSRPGKVREGAVVLDGTPFAEGEIATVIARVEADAFEVGSQDEALLLSAIDEANHGDCADASEVLAGLGRPK